MEKKVAWIKSYKKKNKKFEKCGKKVAREQAGVKIAKNGIKKVR